MSVTNTVKRTVTHVHNGVPATATVHAVEMHGNVAVIIAVESAQSAYVSNLLMVNATVEGIGTDSVGMIVGTATGAFVGGGSIVGSAYGFNSAACVKALRAGVLTLGIQAIQHAVETA
jgi:hypothetical protein